MALKISALSREELQQVLLYDPLSGEFLWRSRDRSTFASLRAWAAWNARFSGRLAGGKDPNGYMRITVLSRVHWAHQLAWLYVTGSHPEGAIDHINGDKADNRFANLRLADIFVNNQNERRARSNNKSSGLLGVSRVGDKFRASIMANGVRHSLGQFSTADEARGAYIQAKRRLHQGCTI